MAERETPLAGAAAPGTIGHGVPSLVIGERRPMAMVHVALLDGGTTAHLQAQLPVRLPEAPNTVSRFGRCAALWLGPRRFLVTAPAADAGAWAGDHDWPGAVATDLSQARCVIRLAGAGAAAVLAKGCPLDFHRRSFPRGTACAQSTLAHVAVLIDAVGEEAFDLYVARSYARYLWDWLLEAGAEFTVEIAPPRA